ncbi:MAG TPA: diguanylate cyclase [Xanthomonadaceae bacterium]|jgi:diguanylate cyclase (GGDEF)-like protein
MPDTTDSRILIIDHDAGFRAAFQRAIDLTDWQGSIAVVATAEQALEQVRTHRLDCILLAASSPGFDGLDLLGRIVAEPGMDAPVFLVLDQLDESLVSRALAAGAFDGVLRSRFMVGSLPRVVDMAIQQTRQRHSAMQDESSVSFDDASGLGNGALLIRDLARAVAAAERSNQPFCLLMMDLQRFLKPGQSENDALAPRIAAEFGQRLVKGGRKSDLFYRLSNQRFAAVLDGTDVSNHPAFTRRIRQAVLMPFRFDEGAAEADIRMGVVGYPTDGGKPEILLRMAETVVQRARHTREGLATSATPAAPPVAKRRIS